MERLTQYFEIGNYTDKKNVIDISNKLPLFENGVIMGNAIDRLAEFEDFMEKNEWDSIDEMDSTLKNCEQKYFKIWQENQLLKSNWNNLKEWLSVKWFAESADLNLGDVIKKIKELEN